MRQYLNLLQEVLTKGTLQENRTGISTLMIPGAMLKFDMAEGFPAVTTKKLAFKSGVAELLGFLRGYDNAKDFRELGCKFWDQNANETKSWVNNPNRKGEDDLGRIYGQQWRNWVRSDGGGYLDQVQVLIEGIRKDPTSRRLIVNAWRPDEFDQMALPPCHILFQVIIEQTTKKMHMVWYQRSNDLFLGIPINSMSYGTLLHLLARITGHIPGTLTGFLADVHIYSNHINQVKLQLTRDPLPLPRLWLSPEIKQNTNLEDIQPDQIKLLSYYSHPAIHAPMAA